MILCIFGFYIRVFEFSHIEKVSKNVTDLNDDFI